MHLYIYIYTHLYVHIYIYIYIYICVCVCIGFRVWGSGFRSLGFRVSRENRNKFYWI